MSKRIKPTLGMLVIKSNAEADSTLARIAALMRNIQLIETGMNDDIAEIRLKAAEQAEPYKQQIESLGASLFCYARDNKAELFRGRRSLDLTFGSFGFRQSTALKTAGRGATWEQVRERLKARGLTDCLRVKEEVDKDKVKGLEDKLLKELGCRLVTADTFFYELAEQELTAGLDGGGPVEPFDDGPGRAA